MRQRRVGAITLGSVLIFYGIIFFLCSFTEIMPYAVIFKVWPVIFLVLGIEVLVAAVRWKDEQFQYDFAAIIMICILILFAMGMAEMDWLYTHQKYLF